MAEEPRIYYVNRTVCDILADLRKCYDTRNFAYMLGILEELQWAANRMEANLQDVKDVRELLQERSDLKGQVFALREEIAKQRSLLDKIKRENPVYEDKPVMTDDEWLDEMNR